ncbi:hypothetical protein AZA_27470 [Nitrospirillum viridazoti Y2]|uniref:Zinc ribbon protein n=1 Tax=Nitrospirillum amazonense TaxID=28077 RepID=A0A560HTR4_9PROT|nr:zinc ribbon domain-containing protein [Nitrospirillum amazonense]EGY02165.1 hypothetical protein AZA_27470 [Nitrospirillum amazonense Y2]TWB50006.1 hypothetical protein FBZ92_124112 [Nitrospirillum amazonense]
MALIKCGECGRDVSDKAAACPGCGAPIAALAAAADTPIKVSLEGDQFIATRALLSKLAVKAVQSLNYKVDAVDDAAGFVSFTTGVTWGSWSGVSGSIYFEEVAPFKFHLSGNAKQNIKGGQLFAVDIGGEAKKKVAKVIEEMRQLARK